MIASVGEKWEQIHFKDSTIFDLHVHPSLKISLFHKVLTSQVYASRAFDPFSVRTDFGKLTQGGINALLSVVYVPEKEIIDECRLLRALRYFMPRTWKRVFERPYFDVANEMLDEIEKAVEKSNDPKTGKPRAKFAHSVADLDAILSHRENQPVAYVHCLEGAHSVEGNLDHLQHFFDRGVAYITLAHFFENEVVHPCYPWPETMQKFGCFMGERDISKGLKPFGEQFVEKMVDLGMLIDLSHCTPPARARIYDIVGNRVPLMATHVGAYEINPSPYNLKDWEIRKISESGGVTGVIFMNYWLMAHETKRGINFIQRTIRHFADVGGVDHVAIGSDFDGFTDPPDDLKDAAQMPKLTQRLVAEDFPPDDIVKILGGNALRVIREGWGKKV